MRQQMTKLFTKHPHQQGITYLEHWQFAMGIAYRLLASVVAFVLHAILPFITIEPRIDLEATAAFLAERNRFIETAAAHGYPKSVCSDEELDELSAFASDHSPVCNTICQAVPVTV